MVRGSLLPMIAGLLALTLTAILGVSSLGSLALTRHRLVALAEMTALHAAESFDPAALSRSGGQVLAPLSSSQVRAEAIEFLSMAPPPVPGLRLIAATSPDGRRARVVLGGTWKAPYFSEFIPVSVDISAEAYSRSIIQ